jgi:hypothetical protein
MDESYALIHPGVNNADPNIEGKIQKKLMRKCELVY